MEASIYEGGYDAVRRYAANWRRERRRESASDAFVPLIFDPGEAYQFDRRPFADRSDRVTHTVQHVSELSRLSDCIQDDLGR